MPNVRLGALFVHSIRLISNPSATSAPRATIKSILFIALKKKPSVTLEKPEPWTKQPNNTSALNARIKSKAATPVSMILIRRLSTARSAPRNFSRSGTKTTSYASTAPDKPILDLLLLSHGMALTLPPSKLTLSNALPTA